MVIFVFIFVSGSAAEKPIDQMRPALISKDPVPQAADTYLNRLNQEAEQKIQALQKELSKEAELKEFRAIREEEMAKRVTEKARLQLVEWLTINGLVLAVASIIGIKSIVDYVKKSATQRIDSVTEKRINDILAEEAKRLISEQAAELEEIARKQISELVEAQKEDLIGFARQQIDQITVATSPTTGRRKPVVAFKVVSGSIDYTADMQPVRNQGTEGSAVGFAVAAALEFQIKKTTAKDVIVSPRYLYYFARKESNTANIDSGALIKDAIKVITTRGAVSEDAWPYKPGEFDRRPPKDVEKAEHYRIAQSFQMKTVDEVISALLQYGPVVCGVSVYDSIHNPKVTHTGILPDPASKEALIAGMPLCLVGYNNDTKVFKFKQSWGTEWGEHGYGYISYAYLKRSQSDSWAFVL
jgi:C1A family cysteine protease